MTKEREPEFTVTDRRRFNIESDTATERTEEREQERERPEPAPQKPEASREEQQSVAPPSPSTMEQNLNVSAKTAGEGESPEYDAPSAEERKAQEEAFRASTRDLDKQMESALGSRAQDLQMTFERFVASLYMSALMQLGLMREQSGPPPQVDLVGARQTIDTLTILAEKTRGNLTPQEETLMQNCLYELRMAYVEVTNVITRAPQPGAGGPGGRK